MNIQDLLKERILVLDAAQAAVLPKLLLVDRVHEKARDPLRLSHDRRSLRELAQRVPVLAGPTRVQVHRLLEVRIERSQQDAGFS